MKINQIDIKPDMKVSELIDQFEGSGVLGAGRVGRACNLLAKMIEDENTNVFMSLGGPLVPGGLRHVFADMIKNHHVDLIVASGANITHDLLESFGGSHYKDMGADDEELNEQGIGRIADVFTSSEDFEVFEKRIIEIFEEISAVKPHISIQELLYEVGLRIDDENSILANAARENVPIFAPGLIDSMFGLQLWMFNQDHDFIVDAVADMHYLSDIVFNSEKVGGILLGGGLTKHYTLASNLLKGGLDLAIQITMDRPESGSLSGAPLEEAKSWSKAKCGSDLATVIGDVTVLFPLILAGALDKISSD
ncbi:MAG: deoxyhypusine synthase [Methanobrevibacter sp.]|uniref:deoxyhypusine synthase n=1 Tax=Methanobrevibacter sp. TaxID=66852 RepID=UPI0026E05060|nr:deoxyhypusine synthase [Methanobrevibacter sp.]MDO5849359.1 deoxyhypusine synthase [Methanobrevibacter sp.]